MALPTEMQSRESLEITPLQARVFLTGTPKSGKTTLAAAWKPETTLIIDTQWGTALLEGKHYVSHVSDWPGFTQVVNDLTKGGHPYKTVVIDMVDDLWNFVDRQYAGRNAELATGTEDYQRSARNAEGMFRSVVGRLLRKDLGLGVWFLSHARDKQEGELTRYTSKLDNRVLTYVQGACDFIFLAETLGTGRMLHTQPSAKFEAGCRGNIQLPDPMQLDAKALYAAIDKGLHQNGSKPTQTKESAK